MIDLHFDRTPNCWKIAIMLEEVGAGYTVVNYDMLAGDHLTPAYGAINANRKLPAIVDHAPHDGGAPIAIAESGAILIYLAEKHGVLLPSEARRRTAVLQWLIWQVAGLGPMMGQASHFMRYAPERHAYSIERYGNESRRLMTVLDTVLDGKDYIAGDYSIADISIWPWASFAERVGIGIEMAQYPNVDRWVQVIAKRPSIAEVFSNPRTVIDPEYLKRNATLTEEQWSNICGERMLAASGVSRP